MLETDDVSQNIHQWFDLIFGHKQKGKAGIEAYNIYPSISYEDGIDLNLPDNIENKKALIIQAYNYGQCPSQLFTEPHLQKSVPAKPLFFIDKNADLQVKPFDLNKMKFGDINQLKFINDEEFLMFGKKNSIYTMVYTPYTEGSKKEIVCEKSGSKRQKILCDNTKIHMNEETPKRLLVKNDLQIIIGGFWDGKVIFQNFTKKLEVSKKKHLYRVTMIEVSSSEEIIITGTTKGDVAKWTNNKDVIKFEILFFHHNNEVTGASINEDMGVFATCSKDGTVNLYTISPACILRTFWQPDKMPLSKVLISEEPLASIIMLTQDLKYMTSFSINGRYISTYNDHRNIENPLIVSDKYFTDRIVYGNLTGKLVFLRLPYFDEPEFKSWLEISSVIPLAVSPDKRVVIFNHVGLWCMGDFVTNIPKEGGDFKGIMGLIGRK